MISYCTAPYVAYSWTTHELLVGHLRHQCVSARRMDRMGRHGKMIGKTWENDREMMGK